MAVIPILESYYNQLNGFLEDLLEANTGSIADISGVAEHKMNKRKLLEASGHKVSCALVVHFVVADDPELLKRATFRASS